MQFLFIFNQRGGRAPRILLKTKNRNKITVSNSAALESFNLNSEAEQYLLPNRWKKNHHLTKGHIAAIITP